jgi:hydrogenase maturation protease
VCVRVIGIGTARGDDAAGLAVVEALRAQGLPPGADALACERPLPDLLDALAGARAAVLVDATRSGAAPGSVRRLARAELAAARAASSHGLGVAEALALAEALRGLPPLALIGIEAGGARQGALSREVAQALPAACAAVRAALAELLAGSGGPSCTNPSSAAP